MAGAVKGCEAGDCLPIRSHKTLEERALEFDGNLMLDGEFEFGKPVGREVWA